MTERQLAEQEMVAEVAQVMKDNAESVKMTKYPLTNLCVAVRRMELAAPAMQKYVKRTDNRDITVDEAMDIIQTRVVLQLKLDEAIARSTETTLKLKAAAAAQGA